MPNRFLREGFLRSAAINDLDDATQNFYTRLLLIVDDFGCYDGRGAVIATQAYPTRTRDDTPDVDAMLIDLHSHDLIVRYANKNRPYLALTQWRCGIRSRRLFPAPPVDVDLYDGAESAPRGPYGRPIIWNNPPGSDEVSILLDVGLRPCIPQPNEWRPTSHCTPITRGRNDYAPSTGTQSLQVSDSACTPATVHPLVLKDKVLDKDSPPPPPKDLDVGRGTVTTDQSLEKKTATTTTPTIEFENGAFRGVTDAQCSRWQGMLGDMSIPDQLERAASWLEVNIEEQNAIRMRGEGFGAFIVRWLLREARDKHGDATGRARGRLDS